MTTKSATEYIEWATVLFDKINTDPNMLTTTRVQEIAKLARLAVELECQLNDDD